MTLTLEHSVPGPHGSARLHTAGEPLATADAGLVLVHGRGARAEDILALAAELDTRGMTLVAPQAEERTWYPYPFLAPLERNEPYLGSALALLGAIVETLEAQGLSHERLLLLGFSQGACLTLEFAGRNARRYGGLAGLSGGLIGPLGRTWSFGGSLDGTPVFLGCSDRDAHIPLERVQETERELTRIGGEVETQIYPDMAHTVNRDELNRVQRLVDRVRHGARAG